VKKAPPLEHPLELLFLLFLPPSYSSSKCAISAGCQDSVEKYHKESEQFILQLTNLAAPPDTKHTDFSQQNALLQNPNNNNNNNFFFF
jgi:hypothetical protein